MDPAWIGVIGGLAGVALGSTMSEVLRRASRVETYASRVFDKRMLIYEELFAKIIDAQNVAEEVMQAGKFSADERHAMVSAVVLDLAQFCDTHDLYLNEELTLHCVGSLMGAEDVAAIADEKGQEESAQRVRSNIQDAKNDQSRIWYHEN